MSAAPTRDAAAKAPLAARACRMRGRRVYLEIDDRREISFPLTKYPVLTYALQVELEKIHLCDSGRSVTWTNLDEVIQVEDVANNLFVHTARRIAGGPH